MDKDVEFERPSFAKWKNIHQRQANSSTNKYEGKHDTRKAYHWVVLENLKYEEEFIGIEQNTWYGREGQPTATGKILSAWLSHGRHCFLVEAWNRKSKDVYLVVFLHDGKFVTAYSKTKEDIPDIEFSISRKWGRLLLRLSLAVEENPSREITEEAIAKCVARQISHNQDKHIQRFIHIIQIGIEQGIIKHDAGKYFFTETHDKVKKAIYVLNPYAWEDFAWQQHVNPYV